MYKKYVLFSVFVLIFIFCMSVCSGSVIYVATDGTGDYNCDGKDDQTELNQAFEAADSMGGGTVYLKSGTYIFSDTLKIGSNTIVTGDSDAVLQLADNVGFSDYQPMIQAKGAENIVIHGFEIDGNYENNDEYVKGYEHYYMMLLFTGVTNVEIYDMYLHDSGYDLIHFDSDSSDISVHDNTGRNQGHEFVWFYKCDNVDVYNNDISAAVNSGIRCEMTNNIKIHNNLVYAESSSGYVGIYVQSFNRNYPVNSVEIYNNIVHDTRSAGIYAIAFDYGDEEDSSGRNDLSDKSQASNLYIHHNIVYDTGLKTTLQAPMGGIYVAGFDNTTIEHNIIDGVQGDGVCIMYNKAAPDYSDISVFVRNNIIVNCVQHPALSGSGYGINNWESSTHTVTAEYNDIYNNVGNYTGGNIIYENNLNVDPLFVDEYNHDYHLKNESGIWSANGWVIDDELSTLIDAGITNTDYTEGPEFYGEPVNIGVFANTAEASKSVLNKLIAFKSKINFLKTVTTESTDVSGKKETESSSEPVMSASCNNMDINYGTINVDGSLADWTDVSGITLYGVSEAASGEDSVAVVKAKYDDSNLYLAYDVKDTDLEAEKVNGQGGLHLDDSIELYIDTLNDKGTAMQPDDYHLIVNLNEAVIDDIGTGSGKDYSYVINMAKAVNLEGTLNDASDEDTGFIIELAVPWDDLGGKPSDDAIGILVAVNDLDIDGDVILLNYCNLTKGSYAIPDNWGTATILPENV